MQDLNVFRFFLGESCILGIIFVYVVKEKGDSLIVIEKYILYIIYSILVYSFVIINLFVVKFFFLLYQILKIMVVVYGYFVRVGDLSIYNVLVDSNFWVYKLAVSMDRYTIEIALNRNESSINVDIVINFRIDVIFLEKIEYIEFFQLQ